MNIINISWPCKLLVRNVIITYEYIGCKHRASEGMFYIGGRGCVLCQFIESVMFACCVFIFALQNIALSGYLDTRRNIYGTTYSLKLMENPCH